MVRWCWVNFQCRGVLLIWIRVGQGPTALAVGAGGGCLDIFSLVHHFSFLSPSLWETARYRLKYYLKGPLSPKQPTNQTRVERKSIEQTRLTSNCCILSCSLLVCLRSARRLEKTVWHTVHLKPPRCLHFMCFAYCFFVEKKQPQKTFCFQSMCLLVL